MREKLVTHATIFARSFSGSQQKMLTCAAIIVSLLVSFNIFAILIPCFSTLPLLNLQLKVESSLRMVRINSSSMADSEIVTVSNLNQENDISSSVPPRQMISSDTPKNTNVECHKLARTEFCQLSGDVRIQGRSATAFAITSAFSENPSWQIKPYARKGDNVALKRVREWTIRSAPDADQENAGFPRCGRNHSVPAVIFSLGGYSMNNFHGFADILLPLFLTTRKFNGEVQFLVTDKNPLYVDKFGEAIRKLSSYELINIDEEEGTHCFTNAIVGLKRHNEYSKEMYIDPSWSGFTMSDFRQFIRDAFALRNAAAVATKSKPRILILSRRRTRAFANAEAMARTAEQVGFEAVVEEGNAKLTRFGQIVNSCDVMVGVHGAGLTNMVFLPANAILIQVIPVGDFSWLARTDYEEPAKSMNLGYLEYKITPEESSLSQKYPRDHEVLKNAFAVGKRGWETFKAVYMSQNVSVDVDRFRPVLVKALQLLQHRM